MAPRFFAPLAIGPEENKVCSTKGWLAEWYCVLRGDAAPDIVREDYKLVRPGHDGKLNPGSTRYIYESDDSW